MLSLTEFRQLCGMLIVGMLDLFVVYLLAPFVIDHIEWFAGASILVAAGGVYAWSRQTA